MDAVLIAIVFAAPILMIAGLAMYWPRKGLKRDGIRKRQIFGVGLIFAALAIYANREKAVETKSWRQLTGTCSILLLNNSGVDVTDLSMALRVADDREVDVSHEEKMPNKSRRWIETRANEFKIESLTGAVGTNRFSFKGAAKKGERLVVAIGAGGNIEAHVE